MNRLFFSFCKNKTYIFIVASCLILIFIGFLPLLNLLIEYLNENNLSVSSVYLFNAMLLPTAFNTNGMFFSCIIDICFFCILLYPVLQVVSFLLIDSSNITILKIGRKKVLTKIIPMIIIENLVFCVIYFVILFGFYCIKMNTAFFDNSFIISLILKFIISTLATSTFVFIYILIRDIFFALLSSISVFLGVSVALNFLSIHYINETIVFENVIYIVVFLIVLYVIINLLSIRFIKKIDI